MWCMALTFAASLAIVVWLRVGKRAALTFVGRADMALFSMALATALQGWGENNAGRPAVDIAIAFFLVGLIGMVYFVSGEVRPGSSDKESQ